MAFLTIFTAPKPFTNPHINIIQRNAIQSWLQLGDQVEVAIIGNDAGVADVARELGARHYPQVACNDLGTPLISSIFNLGRAVSDAPFLAYANADVILLPDVISTLKSVAAQKERFLLVGQRWDLAVTHRLNFAADWQADIKTLLQQKGKLHGTAGSDYFIYPRSCFKTIPDFTVGRAGWDNWMIYHARKRNWAVIDATHAVTIIHQDHDYSHLPGGVPHYRLPETDVNIKLAGGRRTIFRLDDASHRLDGDQVKAARCTWRKFWREVEIFPLIKLHSHKLGWLAFAFFHPVRAFGEVRGWLAYKLGKIKTRKGA